MGWKRLDHPGQRYSVKRDIFKKSNFEVTFLPARESPIETLQVMWYTQLVLRLGTEIFMISRRIKMLPSWAFLGPSRAGSRPSLKIPQKFQRLDISGMKTTKKPIVNISLRFERKKIWPKNGFFWGSKLPPREAPGHPPMGPDGEKRGFKFGFGPKRTAGASFVKIGLGPPTVVSAP